MVDLGIFEKGRDDQEELFTYTYYCADAAKRLSAALEENPLRNEFVEKNFSDWCFQNPEASEISQAELLGGFFRQRWT